MSMLSMLCPIDGTLIKLVVALIKVWMNRSNCKLVWDYTFFFFGTHVLLLSVAL